MTAAITIDDLVEAGLLDGPPELRAPDRDRYWLGVPGDDAPELAEDGARAADLVLSTSGIFR